MKFKFRQGSPYKDGNAQEIGEYLKKAFPDSNFKPDQVIQVARPKNSPLHKYFEWDDTLAAEKWRLKQAQQLVSALYVEVKEGPIRAYEHVYLEEFDRNAYMDNESVANAPELYTQVLDAAKRELIFWKTKFEKCRSHFESVFSAIDSIEKEVPNGKKESRSSGRGKTNSNSSNRNKDRKGDARR